jgi:hypothetical protein
MKQWMLIFLFLVIAIFPSLRVHAEEIPSVSDFYFLFGYQKFIHRDFPGAFESFHQSSLTAEDDGLRDKARLYESLILSKMKKHKEASLIAAEVNEENLDETNQQIFKRLKGYLGENYLIAVKTKLEKEEKKSRVKISLSPFLLSISYSSESPRETSLQYGADLIFSRPTWSLSAFGSNASNSFKTTSKNFNQTIMNFAFRKIGQQFNWNIHSGLIKSEMAAQNGNNFGLGSKIRATDHFNLGFDYSISNYSNSELGTLSVHQANISFDFWFIKGSESEIKMTFSSQTNKATSEQIQNNSSFIENKFYQSFLLELLAKVESFQARTYYWSGEEVFALRNEGRLIFSYPEIHTGGLGLTISFEMFEADQLHLTYFQEDIKIQTTRGQSSSIMAKYDYYFE